MEDSRVGDEELLVARSNQRCRKICGKCYLCQRMKNRTEELVGKLKLSKVPEKPWTYLTVDFITKLPVVAGRMQSW